MPRHVPLLVAGLLALAPVSAAQDLATRLNEASATLMQVRKDKYKDNPIIPEGLDLVAEDDQITHQIGLDDELQVQDGLSELISL